MPGLLCIDGIPVSNEERTKAEVYFLEQQVKIIIHLIDDYGGDGDVDDNEMLITKIIS